MWALRDVKIGQIVASQTLFLDFPLAVRTECQIVQVFSPAMRTRLDDPFGPQQQIQWNTHGQQHDLDWVAK
jgi:hypothetical protein